MLADEMWALLGPQDEPITLDDSDDEAGGSKPGAEEAAAKVLGEVRRSTRATRLPSTSEKFEAGPFPSSMHCE